MGITHTIDIGTSAHDVLRLLHEKGPQRQSQIAQRLQVSFAACNRHFKKLAEENLIVGCADLVSRGGRPSQNWRINSAGVHLFGTVFDDGALYAMLTDFDGTPVWQKKATVRPRGPRVRAEAALHDLTAEACRRVEERVGKLLYAFVGIPGLMAPDGQVLNVVNFPALNGMRPERDIEEAFGVKCFCDSTHHASGLSETRDLPVDATALTIRWDDGIDGALMSTTRRLLTLPAVRTRRRRGIWDLAHVRVQDDGPLCPCGDRGCLEAFVGGAALRERHPEFGCADTPDLARRALAGDAAVVAVLREAARFLAEHLYWMIELFGVDTIYFTGSIAEAFPVFNDAFRAGLAVRRTAKELEEIALAHNPEAVDALVHGAALMARQFYFYPEEPLAMRGLGRIARMPDDAPPAPEPFGSKRRRDLSRAMAPAMAGDDA